MPDFGLNRAIRRAVLQSAREAKVLRPGEIDEAVKPAVKPADEALTPPPAAPEPAPAALDPLAEPALATPPPEPPAPTALDTLPPAQVAPVFDTEEIAQRVSTRNLGDYALDESFQTNFDTITTTDGVKAVIADVAAQNSTRIDQARRGVITNEQLSGLAADLDINQDVVAAVMRRETGGVLNPETILAARQVLNSSAERIYNLGKKITAGQGTDMERLQFRRQLMWHADYQTQFMGARAEAGRALNAFNIPAGADVDPRKMRDLVENMNGYDTDTLAKFASLTEGDVGSISHAARKYTQSKLMGTVNELFINSILSGPVTHVVNASGNLMFQAMNMTETALAARIGRFMGGEEHVRVGEATAMAHGTISALRDGFRLAAKTMKTGVPLDDVVKYEGHSRRSISSQNLLSPEQLNTTVGRFSGALIDGVGAVIRAPTERVMAPTDEFFKTLAYRSELERLAFKHVNDQLAMGVSSDPVAQAADLTRQFFEDVPLKAQQAAEDYTRYATFQNPLGDVGQKFQLAIRSAPVLTLIAPFIRTPVNLFKAGIVDRSPLGLFSRKFWRTMKEGGRERDMMLARISMGTATSAVVASYVMDGTITGGGPQNPEARNILLASGWQPYSIKVGDTYHSYARMEPLAFVIGATADATEILSYINSDVEGMDDEERHVYDAIAAIITGVANNTMSKTFVRGMSDFTEMMSDPKRYFESYSRNAAGAFIPFSSLRNEIGQIQDPYLREAWTVLDQLKSRSGIPGYSESLPPRRDILGQPRMQSSGELLGTMSPWPATQETRDPVLQEIIGVMNATKTVPITMPQKRIEGLRLNATEYDELVRFSRLEPARNGRTFWDELDRVMGSSVYLTATADFQSELLRDVQKRYDEVGRIRLEQENPLFAARIASQRAKRNRLRFGE